MRRLLIIIFCFMNTLQADVAITATAQNVSILINQQLAVEVRLSYPKVDPPDLFSFLYRLKNDPKTDFEVISIEEGAPVAKGDSMQQVLHITLAPKHTGELIFAPGSITFANTEYFVPAIKALCTSSELSTLPMPRLLPLYPERRIELNASNRLALLDSKVLQQARVQNSRAIYSYHLAWDSLAYVIGAFALGVLMLWLVVYYELIDRAKRPAKVTKTPLQTLLSQLQSANLAPDIRWHTLSCALREALGTKEAKNLHNLGLFELAGYVSASSTLSAADKTLLLPAINTLGAICYAAKPATDEEFNQLRSSVLLWIKPISDKAAGLSRGKKINS